MLIVMVTWSTFISASSSTWSGSARPLVEMQSLMSGISRGDRGERRPRLPPVVAGVARPCDPEHGKLRHLVGDRDHLAPRLVGRQLLRDHARAALVGAVVFAIAIVALDVAGRRDGDVHAGEVVVRLLGIAGVVLDPRPVRFVHGVRLRRRSAGGRRAAARRRRRSHRVEVDRLEAVERDRERLAHGVASLFPEP